MVNLENNFWKEYPGLELHKSFIKMFESDKSKDKADSSKIMWAIYLFVNPESNLYNDPNKETTIVNNFIKDSKFKWKTYEDQIYAYKELVLTGAEKALQNWNELMVMRDKSLKELYTKALKSNNVHDLLDLDKMIANTAKLFNDYTKIKKEYDEQKTMKKGNSIKSLSDSDLI